MNIKLLLDRVLIEVEKEETTNSGLIVSTNNKDAAFKSGKVIACGDGRILDSGHKEPVQVNKGDYVIFQFGNTVSVDGKQYEVVRGDDLVMILNAKYK